MAKPVDNKEDNIYSVLYVKDKLAISDNGYHELSMVSDLPSSKET